MKIPANTAVIEGEVLALHCDITGTDPVISWKIGKNID